MYIISSSYGNDSIALIQWAHENGVADVHVVFIDTKWSGDGWLSRVERGEAWVRTLGYKPVRITPTMGFEDIVRAKKGFPNQQFQWCSGFLKGLPFLDWAGRVDPGAQWLVMIGKRREESNDRVDTPEFILNSDYHGGRTVQHPLFMHTEAQRDELVVRAGWEVLPHRSQECAPCVNASRKDLQLLTPEEIERVKSLEADTGQTMFRPAKHMKAQGITQIIKWAHSKHGKYKPEDDEPAPFTCASGYCGH